MLSMNDKNKNTEMFWQAKFKVSLSNQYTLSLWILHLHTNCQITNTLKKTHSTSVTSVMAFGRISNTRGKNTNLTQFVTVCGDYNENVSSSTLLVWWIKAGDMSNTLSVPSALITVYLSEFFFPVCFTFLHCEWWK